MLKHELACESAWFGADAEDPASAFRAVADWLDGFEESAPTILGFTFDGYGASEGCSLTVFHEAGF